MLSIRILFIECMTQFIQAKLTNIQSTTIQETYIRRSFLIPPLTKAAQRFANVESNRKIYTLPERFEQYREEGDSRAYRKCTAWAVCVEVVVVWRLGVLRRREGASCGVLSNALTTNWQRLPGQCEGREG